MQADGAEVRDPKNESLGIHTAVGISPLEVITASKGALSSLSQPPRLQLEVYKAPFCHSQSIMTLRSTEMESFVEEGFLASLPQLTTSKQTSVAKALDLTLGQVFYGPDCTCLH